MFEARTTLETPNAIRYMKALCNHFDEKVTAHYDGNEGTVDFGFADCQMAATHDRLTIDVQAGDEDGFARVKYVVSDHVERFGVREALQVVWVEGV
jgi:hypothetical protein